MKLALSFGARWFGLVACVAAAAQTVAQPPVFRLGPGIAPPFVIAKAKPEYSAEAQLAKLEGSVLLSLVVDASGQTRDVRVDRSLGLGLDESAIANVRLWKFKPGTKAGVPAAVRVNEEVFFHTHRTLWDWHAVRAIFHLAAGAERPVLIQTKFPPTVDEEENASVTIAFDIGPRGAPANARVVKSSDPKWEGPLLLAVREGWRFRPALLEGKPVSTPAWFEFVRGSHSPIPPAVIE
ncbi:MAG TPA: TonB family protein [Bryobacteraceae bacterium]|nr:TonB family protein [Bryobacteraceae bacterium]